MRCHFCQPPRRITCGPFIPTLEQVQEASRRLPNPTMYGPPVIRVPALTHAKYLVSPCCPRCASQGMQEELHVLTFELRADVDEYGCRFVRWMYSGGVRV